ncbi:MAG: DedA family protein [Acidimicrobiia bacterium]
MSPQDLITSLGTIGLIAIVFAESGLLVGLVFPGDSLLIVAGALAAKGKLDLAVILVGVFVAAAAGSEVGYLTGKKFGPALFRRPDSRIFKHEYVHRSRLFFEKHGSKTVFIARFMPFVRTLTPILAGVGEMPRRRFTAFNVVGAAIWSTGFIMLGYFVGESFADKDMYIVAVVFVLSVLPIGIHLIRDHRRKAALPDEQVAQDEAEALHQLLGDD